MTSEWIAEKLEEHLSQGDILLRVPFASLNSPLIPLTSKTFRGGETGFVQLPNLPNTEPKLLVAARQLPGMIVSHDCELDKSRGRVLIAPIQPLLNAGSPDQHERILSQQVIALMPLPGLLEMGDCYVDLRGISVLERKLIDGCTRAASLSAAAKLRLQAQLVAFFTRLALPH